MDGRLVDQKAAGASTFMGRKRAMTNLKDEFALLIGRAALEEWPDMPRDVQERLFERAVPGNHLTRYGLAVYLHDHHPRTAHPPRPDGSRAGH
jgi:hypothetical protein